MEHQRDHHDAEDLRESVHGPAGLTHDEDRYGGHGARGRTHARIDIEQRIRAETRARDVADVERQPPHYDERGQDMTHAGQHEVRDVLRSALAHGDHAPDVELHGEIEQHGHQDGEAEAGSQSRREDRRLREKAGTHR
jgi:hypothetical protein